MKAIIFVWLCLFCSANAVAQAIVPDWATDANLSEAELIRGIVAADDPATVKAANRVLFKKIGAEGIHRLLTHNSDSIALRAAWQEVSLTVPEMEQSRAGRPDRQKLAWFIGFLEGRTRVKAPQWWIEAMLESEAGRRDNIFPGQAKLPAYHDAGLGWSRAPLDTTLVDKDGTVTLRVGEATVAIPGGLLQRDDAGKTMSNVSGLVTKSRCYLAIHDEVGFPYTLACIDRSSGKVRWKADAWGCYIGGTGGQFDSAITVTEQDDRVIVFGGATTGFHVEGFRSDDGKNLFRVSNSF